MLDPRARRGPLLSAVPAWVMFAMVAAIAVAVVVAALLLLSRRPKGDPTTGATTSDPSPPADAGGEPVEEPTPAAGPP